MKKILCPTDFSATADNAIVFAAKLAKKLNASLELFNVQLLADLTTLEAWYGRDINVHEARKSIEEKCLEVSKVFRITCGGEVSASLDSLAKEIRTEGATSDLIVMGTNGEDSLFQYFFGSNTYNVIKQSAAPVLVVPEECGYTEIDKIVYAFDYWRENTLPVAQIIKIATALNSQIQVLQVMEESYSRNAEKEMNDWQQIIVDTYGDQVPIKFDVVYTHDISNGISQFFRKSGADMLALCSQDRGFIGNTLHKSVIKGLIKEADYPVYVFYQ